MNRLLTLLTTIAMAITATSAQTVLPTPTHAADGMSLDAALQQRRSIREFDPTRRVDLQTLSNLLWAAAGINRPDEGKRTNPTALNSQEIDLYVFCDKGVALYDYANNALVSVAEGDHRALVAGTAGAFIQDFVLDAPISIVMVINLNKFTIPADSGLKMGYVDAGIVSQNINLFCAANGLATVPRATMDSDGIRRLLGLDETHVPAMNNPVGYAK